MCGAAYCPGDGLGTVTAPCILFEEHPFERKYRDGPVHLLFGVGGLGIFGSVLDKLDGIGRCFFLEVDLPTGEDALSYGEDCGVHEPWMTV